MDQTAEPTVAFSLAVKDASQALQFYAEPPAAEELYRMPAPDGGIAHAEIGAMNRTDHECRPAGGSDVLE